MSEIGGRHRDGEAGGRRRVFLTALLVVLVGVAVVASAMWLTLNNRSPGRAEPAAAKAGTHATAQAVAGCSGPARRLRVAATPAIADAVRSAVARLRRTSAGRCVAATVQDVEPGALVKLLNTPASAKATAIPDVWVPDSSFWLAALPATSRPTTLPVSVASSPVVVAMPADAAGKLGWPKSSVTWRGWVAGVAGGTTRAGLPTVGPDATGIFSAIMIGRALGVTSGPSVDALAQDVMLRPRLATVENTASGLSHLGGSGPTQALTSEAAVVGHNRADAAHPYAAVQPTGGTLVLDFPYAVLPAATAQQARDAALLRRALTDKAGGAGLAAAGLRTAAGVPAFAADGTTVAAAVQPARAPTAKEVKVAIGIWGVNPTVGRTLAVVDVSGSMAAQVTPGVSRMDIATQAGKLGITIFDNDTELGLWEFSTKLSGDLDYRQLSAIAPLAPAHKKKITDTLLALQPIPDGGTGLYDTVLAAYRYMTSTYDPTKENFVLLLTDGRNEADPTGISRAALLTQLKALYNPAKPVHMIAVGYSKQADMEALNAIVSAIGGRAYQSVDPRQILGVFVDAFADIA